jgi:hypothetical protein
LCLLRRLAYFAFGRLCDFNFGNLEFHLGVYTDNLFKSVVIYIYREKNAFNFFIY